MFPVGVVVQGDEVYVADSENFRVQVFDRNGTFLRKFGSFGSADGQFSNPVGVAVQGNEVFVTDAQNHRVEVFDRNGTFLRTWGSVGSEVWAVFVHGGVAVQGNEVYVVDYNDQNYPTSLGDRVQVFDRSHRKAQVTIDPTTRTVTTPNFDVQWSTTPAYQCTNSPDPEEIDAILWSSTPPPSAPDLTNTFTSSTSCFSGDVEYFGNAWAPPDPQIGGTVLVGAGTQGTWAVGPDMKVIINSSSLANNCATGTAGPAVYAGVPAVTEYQFWNNPASQSGAGPWDRIKVTRQFTFATVFNPNVCGTSSCFRAYIPRLHPTSVFSEVLYPTPGSNPPVSISIFSCPFGCTGVSAPGASVLTPPWDATRRWFAINAPSTDEGVIVTRISTSPADLWVDFDAASDTNSSSILLLAPTGGFTGTVSEGEILCFYDLSTWPLAMRSAGLLPPACGQHGAPTENN